MSRPPAPQAGFDLRTARPRGVFWARTGAGPDAGLCVDPAHDVYVTARPRTKPAADGQPAVTVSIAVYACAVCWPQRLERRDRTQRPQGGTAVSVTPHKKCRSCGADIEWRLTTAGKRCPYDAGSETSHVATCPQARTWSRKSTLLPLTAPAPEKAAS